MSRMQGYVQEQSRWVRVGMYLGTRQLGKEQVFRNRVGGKGSALYKGTGYGVRGRIVFRNRVGGKGVGLYLGTGQVGKGQDCIQEQGRWVGGKNVFWNRVGGQDCIQEQGRLVGLYLGTGQVGRIVFRNRVGGQECIQEQGRYQVGRRKLLVRGV